MLTAAAPWQSAQDLLAAPAGLRPGCLAELHEQHAGIGRVVVLHLLQRRAHVLVARAALVGRALRQREGGNEHRRQAERQSRRASSHGDGDLLLDEEAFVAASSGRRWCRSPSRPRRTTRRDWRRSRATTPCGRSPRPFQVAVKRSMMLRGMMRPLVPGRKPVSIGCRISALISTISPCLAVLGALIRTLAIRSCPRCRPRG